jgi:hypothetical protein
VYVCGLFTKWAKFSSDVKLTGVGDRDIFIAKYDANGNFLWARSASGPLADEAKEVACDEEGNVYLTGFYKDGCKFGSQTFSAPNGKMNCFLAKYSPNGDLLWVRTGGGSYDDGGWGVTVENDRIYVAGEFNSTATFGIKTISTTGSNDILVACYDKDGNVIWLRKAGGKSLDRARGIASSNGLLYITGQFGGTAKFGPYTKTAVDSRDIFIACLDTAGVFKWVLSAGGPADLDETLGYESGIAVCAESTGNVYASGAMLNGASFGSTWLKPWTRTDVFLCKINTNPVSDDAMVTQGLTDSEIISEDILNVFPNPTQGQFTVQIGQGVERGTLCVYNNAGQLVETHTVSSSEIYLDLTNKEKGVYIIAVTVGRQCVRRKILLQ